MDAVALTTEEPQASPFIWQQLPGETAKAYVAFCAYRDAGQTTDIHTVYRAVKGHPEDSERKADGTWTEWCQRWNWCDRRRSYYQWLDAQRAAGAARAEQRMGWNFAVQREAALVRLMDAFHAIGDEVLKAAALPLREEVKSVADLRELIGAMHELKSLAADLIGLAAQATATPQAPGVNLSVVNQLHSAPLMENPAVMSKEQMADRMFGDYIGHIVNQLDAALTGGQLELAPAGDSIPPE